MKLDQFLKWKNLVSSGGEAKIFIKSGSVKVNGVIETRRGRKLNKQIHRIQLLYESSIINKTQNHIHLIHMLGS